MRIILFLFMISSCFKLCGQTVFSFAHLIDGYWGDWKKAYNVNYDQTYTPHYLLMGDYTELIVYKRGDHPSNYIFKLKLEDSDAINSENKKLKKVLKKHFKEGIQLKGSIEYYIKTYTSISKSFPYGLVGTTDEGSKITEKVTVKIFRNKRGTVFNIFQNNSDKGIAIAF